MNLPQMYSLCNLKSGFSRTEGEIYAALDEAGFAVYAAVLKEFRGFFLKFDEVSLVLRPGTQEYTLPIDLTQIVNLAERLSSTENWRPMQPMLLGDALENTQLNVGWDDFYSDFYGDDSQFGFYGPYLDSGATIGAAQTQKIRVSPGIDQVRACQIAYTAKWLPITDSASKVMLPDEGTHGMLNGAVAELRRAGDETDANDYEAKAARNISSFLTWTRNRQIQQAMTITPYGPSW